METGYYAYETASDGLCEYSTKKSAVKHAVEAANREGKAVTVYSPTGKVVTVVGYDDKLEEALGEYDEV